MKRKTFSILFALVLVLSFSLVTAVPVAAVVTLHVDDDGVQWPGAYTTITAALGAAGTGDTIIVHEGTYGGFTVPNTKPNITILGAQTNIDAAGSVDRGVPGNGDESLITGTVTIKADDVTLNGFKMTSSYVAVGYTHAHNVNISYNILENVTATWGAIHLHGTASGPSYHEADGGYIGYNTISDAVGHGIWTVGNDNVVIEYNHVLDVTGTAIDCLNHVGTGIVIHGNTITNPGQKGINYWADAGAIISNNVISGTGWEAIDTDRQAIIDSNEILGGSHGIKLRDMADDSLVKNNIISNTQWEGIWAFVRATITDNDISGCYKGINLSAGAGGSTVSGNTIANTFYEGIEARAPASIMNNDVSGGYKSIAIWANGAVIDSNVVHDNQFWGLSIETGVTAATVTNNQFANNPYCGVVVWGAGEGSGIQIHFNEITGNGIWGVESQRTTSDVDATNNWWGDCSGPDGAGSGSGDAVSAKVDYDPWLGQQLCALKAEIEALVSTDFNNEEAAGEQELTLLAKVDAVCGQYGDGAYRGALNKLQRDLTKRIEKWIDDSPAADLIEMINDEIDILRNFL